MPLETAHCASGQNLHQRTLPRIGYEISLKLVCVWRLVEEAQRWAYQDQNQDQETVAVAQEKETVEEATQSLYPLIAENGMDWMYANCSTTAQRGALDWKNKFRDAVLPVFNDLYDSVASGKEAQRSIDSNSQPDYREKLQGELDELHNSEMWQAGRVVRGLRPENQPAEKAQEV